MGDRPEGATLGSVQAGILLEKIRQKTTQRLKDRSGHDNEPGGR
jgi:hypothetical protein